MSTSRIGPSAAAVAGEPFVTAVVPRAFVLTLKLGIEVAVPAGLQEMPQSIAENWYSKANGVTVYSPGKQTTKEPADESAAVKRGPGRPPKTPQ